MKSILSLRRFCVLTSAISPKPAVIQNHDVQVIQNLRDEQKNSTSSFPTSITQSEFDLRRARLTSDSVYTNAVCRDLDNLILKANVFEDVLKLLVTHRGVYYVHNLVTSIQTLGLIYEEMLISESRENRRNLSKLKLVENVLQKDPRFHLLLRDLISYISSLDIHSLAKVCQGLKALNFRYFPFLNRVFSCLRNFVAEPHRDYLVPLLEVCDCLAWAGYCSDNFKGSVIQLAAKAFRNETDALALHRIILTMAQLKHDDYELFKIAETHIPVNILNGQQLVELATGFSLCNSSRHDQFFQALESLIDSKALDLTLNQSVGVLTAYKKVNLVFTGNFYVIIDHLTARVDEWESQRCRPEITEVSDLIKLVELVGYFGLLIPDRSCRQICRIVLDSIKLLSEESFLSLAYASTFIPLIHREFSYLLKVALRRVARKTTSWEQSKLKVFHIWISQAFIFPHIQSTLPFRTVTSCLREYVLSRRGYGVPFPAEVESLTCTLIELEFSGFESFKELPGIPFMLDIYFKRRKSVVLVSSEFPRNSDSVCGNTRCQAIILQSLGFRVLVVNRRRYLELNPIRDRKAFLHKELKNFLQGN